MGMSFEYLFAIVICLCFRNFVISSHYFSPSIIPHDFTSGRRTVLTF